MGLDGGTIASRADILRHSSWRLCQNDTSKSSRGGNVDNLPNTEPNMGTKQQQLKDSWRNCALSGQALKEPIVVCELGKLYNRDAVIEFLMKEGIFFYSQTELKKNGFGHLVSLKSVFEAKFTKNPESKDKIATVEDTVSYTPGLFVCPVTQLETNGLHQFCAIRACGHVLSEKALNLFAGALACPTCNNSYVPDDVITINGNEKTVEELEKRMKERREKQNKNGEKRKKEKREKSSKKQKKSATNTASQ